LQIAELKAQIESENGKVKIEKLRIANGNLKLTIAK